METKHTSHYIHGSTPEEQQRLSMLNSLLNQQAMEKLNLQGREHVIDIGCGLGQLTRMMGDAVYEKGKVLGIERDINQVRAALQLARDANEAHLIEFRRGDAYQLPLYELESEIFDVAHARFLLEHVKEPLRVLEEMKRALKPGGRIILADDDHEHFILYPEPPGFSYMWKAYIRSYDRLGYDPFIGRKLVSLLYKSDFIEMKSDCLFFGACASMPFFSAYVDNLIGIFNGAAETILSLDLMDETHFKLGIRALEKWRNLPDASFWYTVYWAEGKKK